MDRLDPCRPAGKLARVDCSDAAREGLAVRPGDLDAVPGPKRPFDVRDTDGKEAASVTDECPFRAGIDDDPAGDALAVTKPELERGRPLGGIEVRSSRATG